MLIAATEDSKVWLDRFGQRDGQHAAVRRVDITGLDEATAALLAPSLAIFQLGESGTGAHLFEAARRAHTDSNYQRCLEHFVREEQEHARMLAVVVAKDHGRLLTHIGVSRRSFLRDVLADRRRIAKALFRGTASLTLRD